GSPRHQPRMAGGEAMLMNSLIFYFFALWAVASAILMVTRRNVVHSAVFFVATLVATAGIYLQLEAEFLFAVQLLLFAGGIAVVFLFAIMLTNLRVSAPLPPFNRRKFVAIAFAVILAAECGFAIFARRGSLGVSVVPQMPAANTEAVASRLFSHFMLPLEITAILLLAAMLGAALMVKGQTE
ncbi:MAG: NADH-quinone oxidoreductase subunit J, partial [Candidatus Acidiferrales bacterium]